MNVIKNSSVALTIGLFDLIGRARSMQEFSFRVFEAFTAATVIYLLTNLLVVLAMRALEKKVRVPGLIAAGAYVNLMRSIPLVLVIFWFFFLVPYIGAWVIGVKH